MKLAHIADPHLGIRQYHRQTPAGINQREADVASAFRAAIDGVIAARPDAVVVAGDLFHSVRPTNAAIVFAFRQFQRLREALPDAPIVLIAGNHDTPRSVETGSILRLFEELGVDVAADEARRLVYPDARSQRARRAAPGARWRRAARRSGPKAPERYQVLVLHGEVEGVLPDRPKSPRSTAARCVGLPELGVGGVDLRRPGPLPRAAPGRRQGLVCRGPRVRRAPTSGASWPTRPTTARRARAGCWWIWTTAGWSADAVPLAARILDLEPIEADGQSAAAESDALIAERLARHSGRHRRPDRAAAGVRHSRGTWPGSWTTPRSAASRPRRCTSTSTSGGPRSTATVGVGAPGRRQTLPELVRVLSRAPAASRPSSIGRRSCGWARS